MNIFKYKKKKTYYDTEKINLKHNLWKIENDLNWIFKNSNHDCLRTKISLYWLDIHLKNALFPWVLKIERELKALFIHFYKSKMKTNSGIFLLDEKNYHDLENKKNPLSRFKEQKKELENKSVDEIVFTLTFGEFVNLIIFFNESIKNLMAKELRLNNAIFVNLIKYFIILRNAIAHNKTIIKIKDEKNGKRFSLKSDFFGFEISKREIDIISTNASSAIYVVKKFLIRTDDMKKAKKFIKNIKKNLKLFYNTLNDKKEYERIIRLIFLTYKDEILRI